MTTSSTLIALAFDRITAAISALDGEGVVILHNDERTGDDSFEADLTEEARRHDRDIIEDEDGDLIIVAA